MIVSIAMTTYNGACYLREQLDSILTQSYSDFELVICDDCSTDNTWAILAEYAEKDTRVHCHRNDKNLGCTKNFEKAITLCCGDYIAISDQDDIWTPDHLEVLVANRADGGIVWAQAEYILKDGTKTGETKVPPAHVAFLTRENNGDDLFRMMFFCNPTQGCTMLIDRRLLKKALPFPEFLFYDSWLAIAASATTLRYVDRIIVWYRIHDTNVTQPTQKISSSLQQRIKEKLTHYKTLLPFLHFLVTRPFRNSASEQILTREWVDKHLRTLELFYATFSADLSSAQMVILEDAKRYLRSIANRSDLFFKIAYFRKYYQSIYWDDYRDSRSFKRVMRKKLFFLVFRCFPYCPTAK